MAARTAHAWGPVTIVAAGWLVLVAAPAVGVLLSGGSGAGAVDLHAATGLVLPSCAWAIGVGLCAVTVGRLAAPALARNLRRWLAWVLPAALMPAAGVFYAWYAMTAPDSVIGRAAMYGGWMPLLRQALLAAALVSTTWPLAALLLTQLPLRTAASERALQCLDGVTLPQRLKHRVRVEWPGLLAATGLVAALTMVSTTVFDLAGEATASTELQARLALGAGLAQMAGPLAITMVPAVAGGLALWWVLGRHREPVSPDMGSTVSPDVWLGGIVLLTWLGPLAALLWISGVPDAPSAGLLGATLDAVARAVLVGVLAALSVVVFVAVGRAPVSAPRRLSCMAVQGMSLTWLMAALFPAAFVAAGWTVLQMHLPAWVQGQGVGRVLALLLPATAMALLVARLVVRGEARVQADLRRLDGPPWWRVSHMTQRGMWGVAGLAAAWSMFVPAVDGALAPPSAGPPLVVQLVDAMHYQRPESVILVLWVVAAMALVAGVLAAVRMPRVRRVGSPLLLVAVLVVLPACESQMPSESTTIPLPVQRIVGGPGTAPGRFVSPRAASAGNGELVVIDRSGRLQRIGDTVVEVELPLLGTGFPTGVHLCDDGRALVADTHGSRVLGVSDTGQVGTIIGPDVAGAPTLVSPTDVVLGPDGLLYVSEYGDVDRIAVCTPEGRLLRSLGGSGTAPGQFRRPQAMAFDVNGRLWVADACNHRLQLLDPVSGDAIAIIEDLVRYPYGIDVLDNGDLLVSEYGGNVLRRIDPASGRSRAWGGWGDAPGQLRTPWSVTIDHNAGVVWIVDTGHDQVLAVDLETLAW